MRILARHIFSDALCVVDNCSWTGSEADLLVVTKRLKLIDVEIKCSRSDLKADTAKDKWWKPLMRWGDARLVERMTHPRRIWKHYYALPKDVWKTEWLELVRPESGVLIVGCMKPGGMGHMECVRRATPDRTAYTCTAEDLMGIARLASLRMWDARKALEVARADRDTARGNRVARTPLVFPYVEG